MWNKLISLFKQFFSPKYKVRKSENIPENIDNKTIYIIDDWAIAFKCPCGCGDNILLNTLPDASPCWSYKLKGEKIDLAPSINRTVRCNSHFWIKGGKVIWTKNL